MSLLIGLTGGMGSGKSTVAEIFRQLGGHVIDADEICRELVEPNQPAWKEIVQEFGEGILQPDRSLNRAKMADIVFADPKKKDALETILHPRVFAAEQAKYEEICAKEPDALVFLDAALLIESGNYRKVDKVLVVDCDRETRIQRILAKGIWNREDIERRMDNQMPLEEKLKHADFVVRNDSDLAHLKEQVTALFKQCRTEVSQ